MEKKWRDLLNSENVKNIKFLISIIAYKNTYLNEIKV